MTPRQFSVNCAVCGWAVLDSTPFVYMDGAVERSHSVFIVYDHSIFACIGLTSAQLHFI